MKASIRKAAATLRLPWLGPISRGVVAAAMSVGLLAVLSVGVADAQTDVTPPTFDSAKLKTDGYTLEVVFSEDIEPPALLSTVAGLVNIELDAFYGAVMDVEVDGELTYVKYADLLDDELVIELEITVASGAVVRVAYDNIFAEDAVGLFVDGAGNALQNFSWQTVTNESTVSEESADVLEPSLVISTTKLKVTEGGDAATYTVKLAEEPTGNVTVFIRSESDPYSKLSLSTDSLIFTTENWDTAQTVSVSGSEDDDDINYWIVLEHDSTLVTDAIAFDHLRVLMVEGEEEASVEGTGGG